MPWRRLKPRRHRLFSSRLVSFCQICHLTPFLLGDIDLVKSGSSREEIATLVAEIGFEKNGRLFRHPECDHIYLDFPAGPVSIGDDYHIKPREIKNEGVVIKILSPTD